MGNLIPSGTGLHAYRKLTVNSLVEEDDEEYSSEAEEEVVSEE